MAAATDANMADATEIPLVVVAYGKGLAVFGDTKPWKENLKSMGGKYNGSLKPYGQDSPPVPGWIFGKAKEDELNQFVQQALSGQIQPTPFTGYASGNYAGRNQAPAQTGARTRVAAGPSAKFQTIIYKNIALPYVGQGVTLTIPGDSERMLEVTEVYNNGNMIDVIALRDGDATVTGAVTAGRWEIIDFGAEHTLTFH